MAEVGGTIEPIVMAIIDALPDILIALTDALPDILSAVWDAIVMIFENLPMWFEQLFSAVVQLIYAAFGVIGEWFAGIWENIKEIFSLWEFFSVVCSPVPGMASSPPGRV